MPIVVLPEEDSPLMQGDILRKVPFAITEADGSLGVDIIAKFVLVMSRPCKALRDDLIVVAPVVAFPMDFAEVLKEPAGGLDKMRRYLSGQRDGIKGGDFSDSLYLGTLEAGSPKRFAAQLTTLATVKVPPSNNMAERDKWIREHRVSRLDGEFLRDLHTRLVLTYTRLGFDDNSWFSDVDLEMMISAGEAEVTLYKTQLLAAQQTIQKDEAANKTPGVAQVNAVKAKATAVTDAETLVQPYLDERARRRGKAIPSA